jgi:hypothetical protein
MAYIISKSKKPRERHIQIELDDETLRRLRTVRKVPARIVNTLPVRKVRSPYPSEEEIVSLSGQVLEQILHMFF